MRLDDPTSNVDRSVPKVVHGIPNKTIFPNRIGEASVRALFILELTMDDLTVERSVREMRPSSERVMRNVGGGRVSQRPLVAVDEFRSICKAIMGEEDPFFPTGTVFVDPDRVDAYLGLEEGTRVWATGKRDKVVARTVAVHGGGSR